MSLINIQYGSLASSEVINNNFEYLDNRITSGANNLTALSSSMYSNIANINTTLTEQNNNVSELESDINQLRNDFDSQDLSPDYSRSVSINSFPYTVPADGYIHTAIAALEGTAELYINNNKVGHAYASTNTFYSMISGQYQVKEGDIVSVSHGIIQWMRYFPQKGGN